MPLITAISKEIKFGEYKYVLSIKLMIKGVCVALIGLLKTTDDKKDLEIVYELQNCRVEPELDACFIYLFISEAVNSLANVNL